MRKFLKEENAQISMEFLLILAGAILIASVIGLIIKKTIITPISRQAQRQPPVTWEKI